MIRSPSKIATVVSLLALLVWKFAGTSFDWYHAWHSKHITAGWAATVHGNMSSVLRGPKQIHQSGRSGYHKVLSPATQKVLEEQRNSTKEVKNFPTLLKPEQDVREKAHGSRTLPYYKHWNFTTHQLNLPGSGDTSAAPTSLEILQNILSSIGSSEDSIDESDECFVPQVQKTAALAKEVSDGAIHLSFPFLNAGFPKSGSTTLQTFLRCAGFKSGHNQNGAKMMENVNAGSTQPLRETQKSELQAYTQLDSNYNECAFPQIQFLDELHAEYPNATFILMMRPINDWIRSVNKWLDMRIRWRECRLPGLICNGKKDRYGRAKCTDANLRHWWCNHIKHIREFVKQYPSHQLLEFDLYNGTQTSELLSQSFGTNKTCWGHSNIRAMNTSNEK